MGNFGQSARAASGINQQLNFQGRLLNNAGAVVADGTYNLEFKVYQDGAGTAGGDPGGTLMWTEDWVYATGSPDNRVTVKNGYFSVTLGSICPLAGGSCTASTGNSQTNTGVNFNQTTLWLSVNVGNTSTAATFAAASGDGEMVPMKRLAAAPYALQAANATALSGMTASQFVQFGQNATAQTDGGTNAAVFLNKTSTGNFLELQKSGADVFTVDNSGNILFGSGTNKTISVATAPASTAGYKLSLQAGAGGSGTGAAGGDMVLQGGAAGGTAANGGTVYVYGGAKAGGGTVGNVALAFDGTSAIGGVGIGKAASASYTLDVNGAANASGTISANAFSSTSYTSSGALTVAAASGGALNLNTDGSAAVNVGTTANAVNLNQNTSVAAGKTLTVTSALTSLTGATTGDALSVSNATSSGNIAVFKDNTTAVLTVANEGATTLQNSTNSVTALVVKTAASGTNENVLQVDTTTERVGIGVMPVVQAKLNVVTGSTTGLLVYQNSTTNDIAEFASSGNPAGTVTVGSGSATITGSGTTFTTSFKVGDPIYVGSATPQIRTISTITSDTNMTASSTFSSGTSGLAYTAGTLSTGTVTTNGTVNLVGSGTAFTSLFRAGDTILVNGETQRTVNTVTDDTHLAVTNAFSTSAGSLTAMKAGIQNVTMRPNGTTGFGTVSPQAAVHVVPTGVGQKGLIVQDTNGQTANLLEIQNASGTPIDSVDASGNLTVGAVIVQSYSGSSDGHAITLTGGSQTNGFLLNRNGSGTTTNGLNITSTSGTITSGISVNQTGSGVLTTGLSFSGTIGTDISRGSGSALTLQGTSGVSIVSGGSTSISLAPAGSGGVQVGGTAPTLSFLGNNNQATINFASAASANGNLLWIDGQTAGGASNLGGPIIIQGGTSSGSATGGQVTIAGGNPGGSGANGGVLIDTGNGGIAGTLAIGTSAQGHNINIGTSASGAQAVVAGSSNSGSSVTMQGGSSKLTVADATTTLQVGSFQLQNTSGTTTLLAADTTAGKVTVRAAADAATLGSELATNTFSTTWTGSGWSLGASSATHTSGTSLLAPNPALTVTAGQMYQISYTISGMTAGTVTPQIGANAGATDTTNATEVQLIRATTTGNLGFAPSTEFNGTISLVSVKAITALGATIALNNSSNTAVLEVRSGGTGTTAVGNNALPNDISGTYNTAVGDSALLRNTTGHDNTGVGADALHGATTGAGNTAVGSLALIRLASGSNNTAVGYNAGGLDSTGTFYSGSNLQNATMIGAYAQSIANNALILGGAGADAVNVGIGTNSPDNILSVAPAQFYAGTASQAGTIITGSGTSWTNVVVGDEIIFANGVKEAITGFTDATHITTVISQTVTSQAYRIHEYGLQVTSTGNVGIGTASPTAQLQVVGPAAITTTSTAALQVQDATGAAVFNVDTTSGIVGSAATSAASTNSANLTIQSGNAAGTTSNSGSVTLDSGTATGTAGNVSIGTGAYAHNVTVGNNTGTSAVTIQGGSGNITLNAGNGNKIIVGSATTDTNQVLLQVDSFSTFADTASCTTSTNQGALYYNTSSNAVRGCINGGWEDLVSTAGLGIMLFGVVPDSGSGSDPGDLPALSTSGKSGPCKVSAATASTVNIEGCTLYSGGRKRVVATNTAFSVPLSGTNIWVHICMNNVAGSENVPLATAATTEIGSLPTFNINNPVVCLADVKVSGTTIQAVYDTRPFISSMKEFVTASTAVGNGWIVIPSSGNVVPPGTLTSAQSVRGVVVATNGSTSTTTPNAIIAVSGPTEVKATAGSVGAIVTQGITTNGYAVTGGVNTNTYSQMGYTRKAFPATACTTTLSAANCDDSLYFFMSLR